MSISIDIRHNQGAFCLETAFVSEGRLTALFGPSGSGKTSLVNIIAGLVKPREGRVVIDGRVLVDRAAGVFVPRHRRRIGYVFQDARLFPHMSVAQNLRYGRWFTPAAERYADIGSVIDLLGIGHLLDRRPNLLSGGEKQRVAIGRALLASPRLVLMDEPLAALDEARKAEILPYIERLRDETRVPIVYVSHSLAEVARLATDVVMLDGGKVSAAGPAGDILQRLDLLPRGERGEGGALLDMTVAGQEPEHGVTLLRSPAGDIRVPVFGGEMGQRVRIRIRARDVIVAVSKPEGLSALNIIPGTIAGIAEGEGALADIRINCGGQVILARITRRSLLTLGLTIGQPVHAVIKTVSFEPGTVAAGLVGEHSG